IVFYRLLGSSKIIQPACQIVKCTFGSSYGENYSQHQCKGQKKSKFTVVDTQVQRPQRPKGKQTVHSVKHRRSNALQKSRAEHVGNRQQNAACKKRQKYVQLSYVFPQHQRKNPSTPSEFCR